MKVYINRSDNVVYHYRYNYINPNFSSQYTYKYIELLRNIRFEPISSRYKKTIYNINR